MVPLNSRLVVEEFESLLHKADLKFDGLASGGAGELGEPDGLVVLLHSFDELLELRDVARVDLLDIKDNDNNNIYIKIKIRLNFYN